MITARSLTAVAILGLVASSLTGPAAAAAVDVDPVGSIPVVTRLGTAETPAPSSDVTDSVLYEVDVVVPTPEDVPAPTQDPAPQTPVAPDDGVTVVADEPIGQGRVVAEPLVADDIQTVGVTWPVDEDVAELDPQVRTEVDGVWSDWTPMPLSDAGPDAGTVDAQQEARDGTEAVWVGDVDAVQLSVAAETGAAVDDMTLSLVGSDPVEPDLAISGAGGGGTAVPQFAASASSAPRIYSRAEWGAAAQLCAPDVASRLVGAVLHHTAGSNGYSTVGQAMQQIRNDQSYHMQSRGWCDLGYNAVVDKWGNVYEGRANSLTQPVIGVHAGGFNTGTFGVSILGTYDQAPSAGTQQAVAYIVRLRLGLYGIDPQGTFDYATGSGENSRYTNQTVRLPRVFAHRDVAYTACPGNGGYSVLPAIRALAATMASEAEYTGARSFVRALYNDLLGRSPDNEGLYNWAARVVNDSSRRNVGLAVASSRERTIQKIFGAYGQVLGRRADPSGIQTWTFEIESGHMRVEDLRGVLIASDEYYLRAGGTDAGYVAMLYEDILGRTAGASEVAYWVDGIRAGNSRYVASTGVWHSLESGLQRVNETYRVLLGRSSDPVGALMWAHCWLAQGESVMLGGIVESEEYARHAQDRF